MVIPTESTNEDDIATEALQAQIDLSMAFAQNLVSSWMQPSKLSINPRKKDIENELKEYMRRPPRLGVGAPIPEIKGNSRETARLKGKLAGSSKHVKEEENSITTKQSDDEEESRSGAIKRKTIPDAFAGRVKKKKKHIEDQRPHISELSLQGHEVASISKRAEQRTDAPDASSVSLNSIKLENKKTSAAGEHISVNFKDTESTGQPQARDESGSLEPRPEMVDNNLRIEFETTPKVVDVSLTSTPAFSPAERHREALPSSLPLLNLHGPPVDEEDSEEEMVHSTIRLPGGSAKKKRKRRKKKTSTAKVHSEMST